MEKSIFVMAIVMVTFVNISSQTVDTPYTVGTWHGFCTAATSFTFDDGCQHQFSIAVPMFNDKNLKGTFYTVITGGMFPGWTKLVSAASKGHEIASHTMTHPTNLGTMDSTQQIYELKNSLDSINQHITGTRCIDLAYPNCNPSTPSLTKRYYSAGRICSGQINSKSPTDFFSISCFICGNTGSNTTAASLITLANNAVNSNGWCVYLVHEIDSLDGHNHGGYSPTPEAAIRGWVNYMDTTRTRFWVETFGNVVRYIMERNNAKVTGVSRSADSITLQVTDGLNDTIFNYPITIRRPLPSGWQTVKITQGTNTLSAQIKDSNSVRYVIFDAVPNAGNIVISRSTTGIRMVESTVAARAGSLKTWFTHNNLMVSAPGATGPWLGIALFDLQGAQTAYLKIIGKNAEDNGISVPLAIAGHGMRIIRLSDGKTSWSSQCFIP